MPINNKIAFLTGSARGIGFEIARQFAKAGAKVIIADLNDTDVSNAVSLLKQDKLYVSGITCDVTSESQIKAAIAKAYKTYERIDILVNNAGLQFISPIEDFPLEKFEELIKVMLIGSFITTKEVFPGMKKQAFGRIINMASINGLVGFSGKAAYNSAKHGLIGLTKVTALEGAEFNITANALCPGYVDTDLVRNQISELSKLRNIPSEKVIEEVLFPLVPQKRLLSPMEIADYALFLAGAGGVTGQAVVIDGGYTAQ
ncbi:MAG: 3-hydroxybutyrate dehydrogenase [Daejeonella sp.]|uniref:3-hydroxybutyrate dehydrogenase n=1 Tax=Daejeonella sp. JGW-45 TaxID=3034148 RepID=UPI0023ED29A5|nr:3-hydroxybutyrate dehydrogenase [Daejeonella sp. JGW-45]